MEEYGCELLIDVALVAVWYALFFFFMFEFGDICAFVREIRWGA